MAWLGGMIIAGAATLLTALNKTLFLRSANQRLGRKNIQHRVLQRAVGKAVQLTELHD
jgi:hypothetical protein